ncbi:MAG TPA: hypothetical protein V6C58_04380 [Allocoleopsis sp.]
MRKQITNRSTLNYVSASIEEIAQRFTEISTAGISLVLSYYSENLEMQKKLQKAKILSKIIKLQKEYDSL